MRYQHPIDTTAAQRWLQLPRQASPWLHEEIAQRMQERLSIIPALPTRWCHWEPLIGGIKGHALVQSHFRNAACDIYVACEPSRLFAQKLLQPSLRQKLLRTAPVVHWQAPLDNSVDMLWSNMLLHASPRPGELLQKWHAALHNNGYLMFSCLGPDSLRELRQLYAQRHWEEIGPLYTDMHDWGDLLLQQGFTDPVMSMEHLQLTYESPERLLQDLRETGRNLLPARFQGLRGKRWKTELLDALQELRSPTHQHKLVLTVEIIYGHAFKTERAARNLPNTPVPLVDMRHTTFNRGKTSA